ncbi:glycosyltransferase family 4 protein [Chitinophaga eiseniae]|uniref:Glycosyltransferase family 4 protein n=1 Tax=Chitinophaga eiseniae TaxID=634771 RepID=A0A847SSN0_9BACT|nr:glycosyltransferase family 4 protein [Chitinophaga eiseniae]NLR82107.1 glycosyltransferase family 4 protein [Chitinophaga eiseniae]
MQMMKNVLIISYEFPPIIGGAGVYAHDLAIGLVKNGHKVSLLTYSTPNNRQFLADFGKKYQVACYTIPARKIIHFYLLYLKFKEILKQASFDTIIFSDGRSKKMGALFQSSLKGILGRSVSILHGNEKNSFFEKPSLALRLFGMQKRMLNFFLQQKKIIVVSEAELSMWQQTPLKNQLHLIRHGIDTDIFQPRTTAEVTVLKAQLGIDKERPILLSASRIVKEKGQEVVLESLDKILQSVPDLLFVIVGNGDHLPQLEQMVAARGLQNHVVFAGGVSRDVLSTYLAVCDLFILPSQYYESFGLVYLEAAACGKAAIAGNRGGTNEAVVEDVTGYLVDPLSREAIADKVINVLQNKPLRERLQTNALKRATAEFSNMRMAERIINF